MGSIFFTNVVEDFGGYITSLYPPQIKYIIPKLAFDLLVLSAIGEEPMFRFFVGFGLQKHWSGTVKIIKWNVTYASIISSVIFMLAHINFDLYPFRIINIDPVKLFLNLVLGLFLAIVFEKTRSLLYTALAHTYSNLLIYICSFISAYFLQ